MHRNPIWITFLSLIFVATIVYTAIAGYDLWQFLRLNRQTQAKSIQWSVLSLDDDRFVPFARYQYEIGGTGYQGETRWQEGYLNEWAAREAIGRLKNDPPSVWYAGSNPTISSLQKLFPVKESIYTALLWSLVLYFIALGYRVTRQI